MAEAELTNLIEQLQYQSTALWVLIGIIGVCALVVVLFIVPLLLQMKRTLAEAEKTTKTVNTEIMPRVTSMITEVEPMVAKVTGLAGNVMGSFEAIINGFKFVGGLFGKRKKNTKEE